MISSSGILCTGEKKCMPSTLCGRAAAAAILVMGNDEVLEAKMQSSRVTASISLTRRCFSSRSSKTASITRSARPRPVSSGAAVTSAISCSASRRWMKRRLTLGLSTSHTAPSALALLSWSRSLIRTVTPLLAET